MINIQRISAEEQHRLIEQKLDERITLSLSTDPQTKDYQTNQAVFYDLCKNDWKFFVNNVLWLQDPEAKDSDKKIIPFLLWDYQEKAGDEIVKAITDQYDLPVEKCRKLGLTWLVLAIITWGWLFHEWDALVGSNKAENADKKGDMGTLFEKIRFMVDKLPTFLFPQKLTHFEDKFLLIIHPTTRATIAGEGNNPHFGRSDRRKVIFLDEFSSWDSTDKAAYRGCSATTKSRIPVSTPNDKGTNCYFYNIIKDHKDNDKPLLTLPWTLNPVFAEGLRPTTDEDLAYQYFALEETSPWLEAEIRRASDKQSVAQEILIDYEASMGGKVFGEFNVAAQASEFIPYNDKLPLYVAWDFGLDATAMQFIQINHELHTYDIIDEYQNNGNGDGDSIYHYLDILDEKNYKTAIHFGDPHSGENRSLTSGTSNAAILRKHGVIFKCQRTPIKERVRAGRNIISQVRVSTNCSLSIEMFTSWQMVRPRSGNTGTTLPAHSPVSHIGEAFTYFAYNYQNRFKPKQKPRQSKWSQSNSGVTI